MLRRAWQDILLAPNVWGFPEIFKGGQGHLQLKPWAFAPVLTSIASRKHKVTGRLFLAVAARGIPGGKVSRPYYFQRCLTMPEVVQCTFSLTHTFLIWAFPVSNHSPSMHTGPSETLMVLWEKEEICSRGSWNKGKQIQALLRLIHCQCDTTVSCFCALWNSYHVLPPEVCEVIHLCSS